MAIPLDLGDAAAHHVLALPDDVTPDDVAALAASRVPGAAWLGEVLALGPNASITGPYSCSRTVAESLGLPASLPSVYLVRVPARRDGPPPPELALLGDLLEAFPAGHPVGAEREVLDHAYAAARRLGGALRVSTGVLVTPHPADAVDLVLYAPVWLDPAAVTHVLSPMLPELDLHGGGTDAFAALWRSPQDPLDAVSIEVRGEEVVPPALAGMAWAHEGLISYAVRWFPDDAARQGAARGLAWATARRRRVRLPIEAVARALHDAAGGAILDEDGFLVTPESLM